MGGGESSGHQGDYSHDSESEDDLTWSPGDGICPSTGEFNHCYQSKFHYWRDAASTPIDVPEPFQYYLQAFLDILQDVPQFFRKPPEDVDIAGRKGTHLILQSALQVQTTEDPDCTEPEKCINYFQCLGIPKPATYKRESETQLLVAIPGSSRPLRSGVFTSVVLAWSYILSCRWVEILEAAGQESWLCHPENARIEDSFWDIVTKGYWVAQTKRQRGTFYSPWMLRRESTIKKQYVDYPYVFDSLLTELQRWLDTSDSTIVCCV